MSDQPITREAFVANAQKMTIEQLRAGCAELGHTLVSTRKSDAVDEAWAVYSKQPALLPAAKDGKTPISAVVWEGRIKDSSRQSFRRGGFTFSRVWQALGPLTKAQEAALKAEPVVQIRVRG